MRIDEIFIPLIIKKIKNSTEVFSSSEIFIDLLFWCRECNRERLAKHSTQKNLSYKIDDIGAEVDRHLTNVRLKMLENGKKGKNSLFYRLYNTEKTIKWLIARWGNMFINLATNSKYKGFIDAGNIGCELNENMSHDEDTLSLIIQAEEALEYEKKQMEVEKWDKNLIKMFESGKVGGESSESGGTQMVFLF